MKKNISRRELLFWRIVLYGVSTSIFMFAFFGPRVIRYYKLQREYEMITIGGSKSDAKASTIIYYQKIEQLGQLVDSAMEAIEPLFIYTNDSVLSNAVFYPNIKYNGFNNRGLDRPLIRRNKEAVDEINAFINKKDTLGFSIKIWLENHQQHLNVAKLNNLDQEQMFSVTSFYYYTDEEKADIRKHLANSPKRSASYNKAIEEELTKLDDLQYNRIVLSETELENKKIKSGSSSLFAPKNNSIHPHHIFYFTAYNRQMNMDDFKVKVSQFATMFLKNKTTNNSYYQELRLINNY